MTSNLKEAGCEEHTKPKTKEKNLIKLGIPEYYAHMAANSRRGYWFVTGMGAVNRALTKERLINSGFYDLATAYQSVHINYSEAIIAFDELAAEEN